MNTDRSSEDIQHAGVRRSLRRDAQRRKARQGMRVGARPDALRPVTAARVEKLTERTKAKRGQAKHQPAKRR